MKTLQFASFLSLRYTLVTFLINAARTVHQRFSQADTRYYLAARELTMPLEFSYSLQYRRRLFFFSYFHFIYLLLFSFSCSSCSFTFTLILLPSSSHAVCRDKPISYFGFTIVVVTCSNEHQLCWFTTRTMYHHNFST